MFARENVRHALFRQTAYAADPGAPSGTLVPRDASSNFVPDRNLIENPQIFPDGFDREFVLGNFNSQYNLKAICNFDFLGFLLNNLCAVKALVGNGVASCPVTSGGTGYTTPTVTFTAAPAGGITATGTLTVGAGIITAVVITNAGEGYTSVPTATIGNPGAGTGGVLGTVVLGAPYRWEFHLAAPGSVPLLTELEEGLQGGALFYRYYDLVMNKMGFKCPLEGILTADTTWLGSGAWGTGNPYGTSLDPSAAEIVGIAGEYANITTLEALADPGNITDISWDVVRKVILKRPQGKGGKASAITYGNSTVRGTFTQYFETDAQWTKARGEIITSLKATISGPTNYFFESFKPEVKIKPTGLKIDSEDGVMQQFEFRSIRKSNTTDTPIRLRVANGTATYA